MVLVLRVADTADDLPEALALDHPDGRVTLAIGGDGEREGTVRQNNASSEACIQVCEG